MLKSKGGRAGRDKIYQASVNKKKARRKEKRRNCEENIWISDKVECMWKQSISPFFGKKGSRNRIFSFQKLIHFVFSINCLVRIYWAKLKAQIQTPVGCMPVFPTSLDPRGLQCRACLYYETSCGPLSYKRALEDWFREVQKSTFKG